MVKSSLKRKRESLEVKNKVGHEVEKIFGFGGHTETAVGIGSIAIRDENGTTHLLHDVLDGPAAENPILSLVKALNSGWEIHFSKIDNIQLFHPNSDICSQSLQRTIYSASLKKERQGESAA